MLPQMMGLASTRVALPLDLAQDGPIYVNAKQYHGILRRRQSRAKLEAQNKLIKNRKVCSMLWTLGFFFIQDLIAYKLVAENFMRGAEKCSYTLTFWDCKEKFRILFNHPRVNKVMTSGRIARWSRYLKQNVVISLHIKRTVLGF